MKEINLKVDEMICNRCENRVINVLKNIDGVENVIEEKIKELGFEIMKGNH